MPRDGQPFNPFQVFNGIFIPEALVRWDAICPGSKLCYGRLCRYAGHNGRCWPSHQQLADELGVSTKQVGRYLAELKEHALIRSTRIGLQQHNVYEFLWHQVFNGSERTQMSAPEWTSAGNPERTHTARPERTRSAIPSTRESMKKSASPTPNPSLDPREGNHCPPTRAERDRETAIEMVKRLQHSTQMDRPPEAR
jgi:DNA-binding transcriptional MocR family regulator